MEKTTPDYQLESQEVQNRYQVEDALVGLDDDEAQRRLAKFGPNKIESKPVPKWKLFLRQFNNMIIYILMIAALLTVIMGHYSDALIIALVIVANAVIGYVQEANASDAIEKIKSMLAKVATVYRNGQRQDIPAEEIVVGDVVYLEAGDNVPADLRIVDEDNLRIQEASLTGEADSIEKVTNAFKQELPLAERYNLAYASTAVTNGTGLGIVTATADETEIGKISREVNSLKGRKTPLMQEIDGLGRGITIAIMFASIVLFLIGLWSGVYSLSALALAVVTMIVGSVPEGLPATTSVILAMGVRDLAKKKAVVKTMPAAETLGSVDVIATDKTGTLTKNEMTLQEIILADRTIEVTGVGYTPAGTFQTETVLDPDTDTALKNFLVAGFEANDSVLQKQGDTWQLNGEPTDGAFLTAYYKAFATEPAAVEVDRLPFDSDTRIVAKLVAWPSGKQELLLKGSPDKLLPMAGVTDDYWFDAVSKYSKAGKRVVAVASKEVASTVTEITSALLADVQLLGLAAIIDPPRPEVITALKEMRQAGVAVKMITGDHPLTASAIGSALGLADEIKAVTGPELDKMNETELAQAVAENQVFARTTPQNKLQIVEALQTNGKVTAMTGDGVNDAPALKKADIGVAMGISGTDVAKDAADMILTDDHFATMAVAIKEGRRIYDNIKKSILFLLPTSFAEGLIIAFTILTQQEMPLQATQLLWINMVSAITIQFAFIFEPAEAGIMERPPRQTGQSLMSKVDVVQMAYISIFMALVSLFAHDWLLAQGADMATASTMMVNIMVLSKIFYLFSIRTKQPAYKEWTTNRPAFVIIGIMLLLQLLMTYVPFMQQAFHTVGLNSLEWGIATLAAFSVLLIAELGKFIQHRFR